MYNLCAKPRTFPRHGDMVQWPNSSPSALNWWMVCDMEWAEQDRTGLGAMNAVFWAWLTEELNSPRTGVCWEIYYAGCDLHQPGLLSKTILWECQNATPHCSIHIKSVLFTTPTLSKTETSDSAEKTEYIYSPVHTGIQKTNFLFLFPGKGSQSSQKTESQNHLGWQRCLRSLSKPIILALPMPPLSHIIRCHINTSFKSLQEWCLHHSPVSSGVDNSSSQKNLSWLQTQISPCTAWGHFLLFYCLLIGRLNPTCSSLSMYLILPSRWWIKILKKPGPNTEPWRTPLVTSPNWI